MNYQKSGERQSTKYFLEVLLKTFQFENASPGDRILDSEVEQALGLSKRENRFRSITDQWRRILEERHIVLNREWNKGFYVASVDDVLGRTPKELRAAQRKIARQQKKLIVQKPETAQQRESLNHQNRVLFEIQRHMSKAEPELLSFETKQPPTISVPSNSATVNDEEGDA